MAVQHDPSLTTISPPSRRRMIFSLCLMPLFCAEGKPIVSRPVHFPWHVNESLHPSDSAPISRTIHSGCVLAFACPPSGARIASFSEEIRFKYSVPATKCVEAGRRCINTRKPLMRRSSPSRLLFSVNLGEDDEEKKGEMPAWVRSLRVWEILNNEPTDVDSASDSEKKTVSNDKKVQEKVSERKSALPLANLINVEALLAAGGEEVIDADSDLVSLAGTSISADIDPKSTKKAKAEKQDMSLDSATPLSILPGLEQLGDWNQFLRNLQQSIPDLTDAIATEDILKEATSKIEVLVNEAAVSISPSRVVDLILRASRLLASDESAEAAESLVKATETFAREQGLDLSDAAAGARANVKYTTNLIEVANGVLLSGYVSDDVEVATQESLQQAFVSAGVETTEEPARPLFQRYPSARSIPASRYTSSIKKAADAAQLAGAIYQDTVALTHSLEHTFVANGTAADTNWMITDSIAHPDDFEDSTYTSRRNPMLVRTITIRGFDASDENVDRERLLGRICTGTPSSLGFSDDLQVHSGLLGIAKEIYREIEPFIQMTAPQHKIVLNGHSVGGSISVLLLLLLVEEFGADFVKEKVLRVFTFGSPPVCSLPPEPRTRVRRPFMPNSEKQPLTSHNENDEHPCNILRECGLPASIVYGYVQPWDPIVRLFTNYDPLYPLLGDMGKDGVTLYASGPPRSLRPITRAIIESWEGWPKFRDTFRSTASQNYTAVGVQHIFLPEAIRYLTDRLVSVQVQVPPLHTVISISSKEVLPALETTFPLDTFSISFIPTALRSFIHHFYPAYGMPFYEYANNRRENQDAVAEERNGYEEQLVRNSSIGRRILQVGK